MNEKTKKELRVYTHAVVILNYNDWKTCCNLIDSINNYNCIDYIVVVDNNSKDDSFSQISSIYEGNPKLTVIESGENKGYAFGNNVGCRYAIEKLDADFITIANPDISFTEETMEAILDFLFGHKSETGAVGCMMKCHSKINLPSAWKLPGFRECVMENLIILRRLLGDKTLYDRAYYQENDYIQVGAIAGSFFTINSSAYEEVGGFDEHTFLYYEENIFGWKLSEKNYKRYILTRYQFEHYHSISIDKEYNKVKAKLKLAYRSREYYAKEYLRCEKIRLLLLKTTFVIGSFNYRIAKMILNKISS